MEDLKGNETEAVLNFKAITEVSDTKMSIKYLTENDWDVTVIYTSSIESSREVYK